MSAPFPDPKTVIELFRMLVGKAVPGRPMKPGPIAGSAAAPLFAALYTADGDSEPSATMIMDLPLALAASASLSGIPAGVVQEELRQKNISPTLRTNLTEVMNIAASLLNSNGSPHIRLTEVAELRAKPDDKLQKIAARKTASMELEMVIPPCPPGRLILLRV